MQRKSDTELQKELCNYGAKRGKKPALLKASILNVGYFRADIVAVIHDWLKFECDEPSSKWINSLNAQLQALDQQPNVSQAHLNSIWLKFWESKSNRPEDIKEFSEKRKKKFLNGNCVGYSQVAAESFLLEYSSPQPISPQLKVRQALETLSEEKELDKKKDEVNSVLHPIFNSQHGRFVHSIPHLDWHKHNRKLLLLYTICIPFTIENIELICREIIFAKAQLENKLEYSEISCLFEADDHLTVLNMRTHVASYTHVAEFYDSNCRNGTIQKISDISLATDLIYAAHQFSEKSPILRFRIYGLHQRKFIAQSDFFKKVMTSELTFSDKNILLYNSVISDCEASFEFWKTQGAYIYTIFTSAANTTLLHECARYGRKPWIRKLVSAGLDINAQTTRTGSTALHIAAEYGFVDVAAELMDLGARTFYTFQTKDSRHQALTPMGVAIKRNRRQIVEFFISHSILDDAVGISASALKFSVELDRVNIAKLLINSGAELGLADFYFLPLLKCAKSDAMRNMLMDVRNRAGRSILEHAAFNNCLNSVRFIVEEFRMRFNFRALISSTDQDIVKIYLLQHQFFRQTSFDDLVADKRISLLLAILRSDKKLIKMYFNEASDHLEEPSWQEALRVAAEELPCNAIALRAVRKQIIKHELLNYQKRNRSDKLKVVCSQNLYKAIKKGDKAAIEKTPKDDPELMRTVTRAVKFGFVST